MENYQYEGTDSLEVMKEAKNYNNFLINLILKQLKPGNKVLDIGAGIGTFASIITSKGYEVHCVEPDELQLKLISKQGLTAYQSIQDVPDNSFDFIYSFNVLEHVEQDTKELALWGNKLKPGGSILIYIPAFQLLYSSHDEKIGHYRRYRKNQLVKQCQQAGLHPIKARYADCVGFFAALTYKFINKEGSINKKQVVFFDRYLFPLSKVGDFFCSFFFGKNVWLIAKK